MIESDGKSINNRKNYREAVNTIGKKEFTLLKMQEYGFWPENLPTPYERQESETEEEFLQRQKLLKKYQKIVDNINFLYKEKDEINEKLGQLQSELDDTWDYEKIRKDVSKKIMEESIARRKAIKEERELKKKQRSEQWKKAKKESIVFIGVGYSSKLCEKDSCEEKLNKLGLPIIKDDKELARLLEIEYNKFRFLVYHRDVVTFDNYTRYSIPKKKGGYRNIAAPKTLLKKAQKNILNKILCKIEVNHCAHGFIEGKSVITGAKEHKIHPKLLINMDLENFFPTITFGRVRGMFESFGYSGYISSLLAMICTYCERIPIEVKGETKYVKVSERILPQGSPASPMITNIICSKLDKRLSGVARKYNFTYTRYADDMSFSFNDESRINLKKDYIENSMTIDKVLGLISKIIDEEGFKINKKKTRFLRENNCQSITGVVINNEEIGVQKKWIKNFRAAIYNANRTKMEKGKIPDKTINEIKGMAVWLKSVNEEKYKAIIESAFGITKK